MLFQDSWSQTRYWQFNLQNESYSLYHISMMVNDDSLIIGHNDAYRSVSLENINSISYVRPNSFAYALTRGMIYGGIAGAIITPIIMTPKEPSGGFLDFTPSEGAQRVLGAMIGGLIGAFYGGIIGGIIGVFFKFDNVYIFTDLSIHDRQELAGKIIVKHKLGR
jgi:hypothetical protein